jgi:phosphohistidine phosphatase SixA
MNILHFIRHSKALARVKFYGVVCLVAFFATQRGVIEAAAPSTAAEFKVTTVYLVRHAEKAAAPAADPPLLEAGARRARELARTLGEAGIKNIYTSQFLRTKQTAEPLAKQVGVEPTVVPVNMSSMNPKELSPQYLKDMTGRVYSNLGGAMLIVGHSNTVPEIIKALGGDIAPAIDDAVFDDLFVVTVYAKGKAKVAHLKQ